MDATADQGVTSKGDGQDTMERKQKSFDNATHSHSTISRIHFFFCFSERLYATLILRTMLGSLHHFCSVWALIFRGSFCFCFFNVFLFPSFFSNQALGQHFSFKKKKTKKERNSGSNVSKYIDYKIYIHIKILKNYSLHQINSVKNGVLHFFILKNWTDSGSYCNIDFGPHY